MFCVCVACSCVCSVVFILTTLTYFTIQIQICVRCYSSGLILVCQFVVLHVLYVCCVCWVVTLCSQLWRLCLRFRCVRVVALVVCVVYSPTLFFSHMSSFLVILYGCIVVVLVCLLLHMCILFICFFI